ncbi:hypothetical protein [Candidatus Phytoplasma sacchari]|uniref:Uncharacterized protein n=1 Tax=Candidatus Phytoplasma sacchari TaxID=2609813 RepID=A0ABY7M3A4_9MOLU|nr:hypothetical protein O7R10_00935 [Candidatus Phytoplasma sacchari]
MIQKQYTFYGLNGIEYYEQELEKEQNKPITEQNQYLISFYKQKINTQKLPNDFLKFVKKPFKEWKNTDAGIPTFDDTIFTKQNNSLLYFQIKNLKVNNYINFMNEKNYSLDFTFEGPQYLLEKDKDYYLGKINLPYYNTNKKIVLTKKYNLHFNPIRNTLSVYNDQFNTK